MENCIRLLKEAHKLMSQHKVSPKFSLFANSFSHQLAVGVFTCIKCPNFELDSQMLTSQSFLTRIQFLDFLINQLQNHEWHLIECMKQYVKFSLKMQLLQYRIDQFNLKKRGKWIFQPLYNIRDTPWNSNRLPLSLIGFQHQLVECNFILEKAKISGDLQPLMDKLEEMTKIVAHELTLNQITHKSSDLNSISNLILLANQQDDKENCKINTGENSLTPEPEKQVGSESDCTVKFDCTEFLSELRTAILPKHVYH